MRPHRAPIPALLLLIGLQCGLVQPAAARTWFVERDGSGDYTVIQHAVDAAVSGDTIRIGPGRFDEKHFVTSPGWSDSVRVHITQQELTIVGSGPQTIIGQVQPWSSDQGMHKGIATADLWGNSVLRVANLHMENMRDAVYTSYESGGANTFEINDCTFMGNDIDLLLIGNNGNAEITDCTFQYLAANRRHVIAWSHSDISIRGCTFALAANVIGQGAVGFNSVQRALIEGCQVFEGSIGVTVSFGGPVQIRNCLFDGQGVVAVDPSVLADVVVSGCTFRNQKIAAISNDGSSYLVITDSVVENVTDCTILVGYTGAVSVHASDLAAGDRGAVWVMDGQPCAYSGEIDMTDNYWGTDDPDSLRALIHDRTDTTSACYLVNFEPFRTESVPTEKKSLGDLKALFLGR